MFLGTHFQVRSAQRASNSKRLEIVLFFSVRAAAMVCSPTGCFSLAINITNEVRFHYSGWIRVAAETDRLASRQRGPT